MQKRRHEHTAHHQQPSQKDVSDAILSSTLKRWMHVPENVRPRTIDRSGTIGLTYASTSEVRCLGDTGSGEQNLVRWAISTDQVDRGNDIVDPAGVFIKRFMDNPVILWNHESFNLPIGIGVGPPTQGVMADGKRRAVMLDILFHLVTRESQDIAALVRGGFLRANSIGFIPLSYVDEPSDNYEDAYEWLSTVRTFKAWELLEDSICAIPMNPGALVQNGGEKSFTRAVELGLLSADSPVLNQLIKVAPIAVPTATSQQHVALISSEIRSVFAALVPQAQKVAAGFDQPAEATSTVPAILIQKKRPSTTTSHTTSKIDKSMHDTSTAMFILTGEDAKAVLGYGETISDADLAPDGREPEPHITVKYGVRTDNPAVVSALVASVAPITVTLGETAIFEADEERSSDVVHVEVIGRDLMALNDLISTQLSCKGDSYDGGYAPHITLAYVKPGRGSLYAGPSDLTGRTITFTSVTFSDPDGTETDITLGGTPTTTGSAAFNPNSTMVRKDGASLAVPDPNAAPTAPTTTPVAPAPDAVPAPTLYDDAAYIDGVLAGLQKIVADSMTATVSSLDETVKTAAQSAVDILTPGIEEFTALKDALAPASVAAPAPTDPAAPAPVAPAPAAPAPVTGMSWRQVAKIGAQFNAKNRAHIKTAHAAISELMAAAESYNPADDCDPNDEECLDESRAMKLANEKALEENKVKERKEAAIRAAQKRFGHLLS